MSLDIHIERLIDAPIELVYNEWLDPVARLHWYAPVSDWVVEATSDLRIGGEWFARFGPADGDKWTESGQYTLLDPPHQASYTTKFEHPSGEFYVTQTTITLSEVDGKTRLALDDKNFPNETQRAAHEGGWPSFIDAFERHLSGLDR